MLHSLVIGITLSITAGHGFSEPRRHIFEVDYMLIGTPSASLLIAVLFHQLFEGISLGVRISSLPNTHSGLRILLCFLFAITMPVGIIIGLSSFAEQRHRAASHFAQGLMVSKS